MPFLQENPRFKGITLPPSGWVLAVLILLAVVMPPIMRYVAEHRNRKK